MKNLLEKRDSIMNKYKNATGLQKGFTLLEMLAVVVIIIIVLGIMALNFGFFGKVDGTELAAQSKQVESAVLQSALADPNRDIPGVYIEGDKTSGDLDVFDKATRGVLLDLNDAVVPLKKAVAFENVSDAEQVLTKVSTEYGLTEDALLGLMRPVHVDVENKLSGKATLKNTIETTYKTNYYVIVKKSQLYTSDVADYVDYNDGLAGQVFSYKTVVDSDKSYYNGTHVKLN